MTLGETQPVTFGKFFGYFALYWNYCRQLGVRYNNLEVFVLTKQLYEKLEIDWKKNKWDIQELIWICYAIEQNYGMLNPANFLNDECAYVNLAKNYFYLEHFD